MPDHEARIAVLETNHAHHRDTLKEVEAELKTLNGHLNTINRKLDKNTGFIAGAAFVFSLIGAVFGAFGAILFKKGGVE